MIRGNRGAYRKRNLFTRRAFTSAPAKRRKQLNKMFTKKVNKVILKKAEHKIVRNVGLAWTLSSGQTIHLLNGVSKGTGRNERIGNDYYVTSIQVRVFMATVITAQTAPFLRIIFWRQDKGQNASPNAWGCLEANSVTAGKRTTEEAGTLSQKNIHILKDVYINFPPQPANTNCSFYRMKLFNLRFKKPLKVTYGDATSTGTITGMQTNPVWMSFIGYSTDTMAGSTMDVRMNFRDP